MKTTTEEAVFVIRKGLTEHARKSGDRGIMPRCVCTVACLDHQQHQAEAIATMLEDAGFL